MTEPNAVRSPALHRSTPSRTRRHSLKKCCARLACRAASASPAAHSSREKPASRCSRCHCQLPNKLTQTVVASQSIPQQVRTLASNAPDSTASRVLMYSCAVTLPSMGVCSGRPRPASSAAAADLHSLTRVLNPDAEASAAFMPENASRILNGGSAPGKHA